MFSQVKCLSLCKKFGGLFFIEDFLSSWIQFYFRFVLARSFKIFAGKTDFDHTRELLQADFIRASVFDR